MATTQDFIDELINTLGNSDVSNMILTDIDSSRPQERIDALKQAIWIKKVVEILIKNANDLLTKVDKDFGEIKTDLEWLKAQFTTVDDKAGMVAQLEKDMKSLHKKIDKLLEND